MTVREVSSLRQSLANGHLKDSGADFGQSFFVSGNVFLMLSEVKYEAQ